ncbi:hypothetical protein GCM10023231_20410 [Olivibacter ginsenosidimutans]|uniref:PE-PGRS family protein n=1 Tax=Olivibacter ginsenosidimutans TaxID=1176537 RepID=A0ABP9B8V4_9SPHI
MRLIILLLCFSFFLSILTQIDLETSPFGSATDKGHLRYSAIDEASGLESALNNPHCFWTHNDSGDKARIFLLDSTANCRATYYLAGIHAYDWEDIASMQEDHKNYLLVGDVGDNLGNRPVVYIHRFEEPTVTESKTPQTDTIPRKAVKTYTLRYVDGPRDAEAFFFDPIAKKLVVINKRELQVGVYMASLPKNPTDTIVLKREMSIPYTFITSATISADGTEVLIKNLLNVYYWKRKPGESLLTMFHRQGISLPYVVEPQGEAITFARDGSGYFTISERPFGLPSSLYFYPRQ